MVYILTRIIKDGTYFTIKDVTYFLLGSLLKIAILRLLCCGILAPVVCSRGSSISSFKKLPRDSNAA